MKTSTKSTKQKPRSSRRAAVVKSKPAAFAFTGKPGDVARAMFAQWDQEHVDPKPISEEKFMALLEENRLRTDSLFAK